MAQVLLYLINFLIGKEAILTAASTLYYKALHQEFFFGLVVAVYGKLPRTVRSRRSYMVLSDSYKPRILQQIYGVCQQTAANRTFYNKFTVNRSFCNTNYTNCRNCINYINCTNYTNCINCTNCINYNHINYNYIIIKFLHYYRLL